MNALHDDTATAASSGEAAALREAMIDELRTLGAIRSDEVARAVRVVPRHLFVPGESLGTAYAANSSVLSKRDAHGVVISTVSAAHIQAVMLEQAQLRPGMWVLEIGSGGYNAALIAELVGEDGEVTTVDIDPEIVDRARECLDAAGYGRVHAVVADADGGVPDHGPYDRVIVTVRAWDIPPAWVDQLVDDGRIVVPLRLRGLTRTVALDRVADQRGLRLVGDDVRLCSFVPMQGAGAHDEHLIPVDGDRIQLRVDGPDLIDAGTLREALHHPRLELWSGVEFDHVDELDLWLGTWLPGFGILTAEQGPVDDGILTPAVRRGAPTAVMADSLAYRTKRAIPGSDAFETGVLAWGPNAAQVGERYVDVIRRWDRYRRGGGSGPRIDVVPAATTDADLPAGQVLDKRHTRVVLSWP